MYPELVKYLSSANACEIVGTKVPRMDIVEIAFIDLKSFMKSMEKRG